MGEEINYYVYIQIYFFNLIIKIYLWKIEIINKEIMDIWIILK